MSELAKNHSDSTGSSPSSRDSGQIAAEGGDFVNTDRRGGAGSSRAAPGAGSGGRPRPRRLKVDQQVSQAGVGVKSAPVGNALDELEGLLANEPLRETALTTADARSNAAASPTLTDDEEYQTDAQTEPDEWAQSVEDTHKGLSNLFADIFHNDNWKNPKSTSFENVLSEFLGHISRADDPCMYTAVRLLVEKICTDRGTRDQILCKAKELEGRVRELERFQTRSDRALSQAKEKIIWYRAKLDECETHHIGTRREPKVTVLQRSTQEGVVEGPFKTEPRSIFYSDVAAENEVQNFLNFESQRARDGPVIVRTREMTEQAQIDRQIRNLHLPRFTGSPDAKDQDERIFSQWFARVKVLLVEGSPQAQLAAIVSALKGPAWNLYMTLPKSEQESLSTVCSRLNESYKSTMTREQLRSKINNLSMGADSFEVYHGKCVELFAMRLREYGEPLPEIDKKEQMLMGLPHNLSERIKLKFPLEHTDPSILYTSYVNSIKPIILEWENSRRNVMSKAQLRVSPIRTVRRTTAPPRQQSRPFQRPQQQKFNVNELYESDEEYDDDELETSGDEGDEAADELVNLMLRSSEESGGDEEEPDWEAICVAEQLVSPKCFICLKAGHNYRECDIEPDAQAQKRIRAYRKKMLAKQGPLKKKAAKVVSNLKEEQGKKIQPKGKRVNSYSTDVKVIEGVKSRLNFDFLFNPESNLQKNENFEMGELEFEGAGEAAQVYFDVKQRVEKGGKSITLSEPEMRQIIVDHYIPVAENTRSPDEKRGEAECERRRDEASDPHRCELTLTIEGKRITGVLADSGAQSNVCTMGFMCAMIGLDHSSGFRRALSSCKFAEPGKQRMVKGLGGKSMLVQAVVILKIEVNGEQIRMPFMMINEPSYALIIGTPGLRALGFKLKSPKFGNRDFLVGSENQEEVPCTKNQSESDSDKESEVEGVNEEQNKPQKKKVLKKRALKAEKSKEEPTAPTAPKRGRGRPPKAKPADDLGIKDEEIKDPLVRNLLNKPPLTSGAKNSKKDQDFREAGVARRK